MSVEGLLIGLVIVVFFGVFVFEPLLRHREGEFQSEGALTERQRERLLTYYDRVLTNIRDLDEDHATGKLATEAYAQEREAWVQRGIQVLRALETIGGASMIPTTAVDDAAIDQAIDTAIESAVASYREKP